MGRMFYECNELEYLDLSNFNTSNITNMDYMFAGCNKLKYLNLSNFPKKSIFMKKQCLCLSIRKNVDL